METYNNLSRTSGIESFLIEKEAILVKFRDGDIYLYDYSRPGKQHVEEMKKLARSGKGLATYINQYVRGSYARML